MQKVKKVSLKDLRVESFVTSLEQKEVKGGNKPTTLFGENTCIMSWCIGVCVSINVAC